MDSIGGKIRQIRSRLGLNQATLAEALGVTQTTISRWEQGSLKIDLATLVKLTEISGEDLLAQIRSSRAPTPADAKYTDGPIPTLDALAALESIFKRYLRAVGHSEDAAEASAPKAALLALKAIKDPPEPTARSDRSQSIRWAVDAIARKFDLAPKQ